MSTVANGGQRQPAGRDGGAYIVGARGQLPRGDAITELSALVTKLVTSPPEEQFSVFSDCALQASVWVHQGRLAKRDMVDRFMQAAEAYGLVVDYGIDGIQNVLANTLNEAAAMVRSDGHNKDVALSALPALPALSASHDDLDRAVTGTWAEPDWTILDDRRGELPQFPTNTLPAQLQDWLRRAARGAGATEAHVAVPLIAIASSLIGTARRVRASSSWSEPCTMWTAVVGFSGTGKTPGIDVTKRALAYIADQRKPKIAELQREHESQVEIARAEHKKWKEAVMEAIKEGSEPPPMPSTAHVPGPFVTPRLYVSSSTIERIAMLLAASPKGLLYLGDELAGLFLNMRRYSGGQDNEFWLEAWNGGQYTVERVNRAPVTVDHLLVGMTGGFQPDKLARSFDGDADGMYARICFGWPEEASYQPLTNDVAEIEPEIINALNRIIDLPAEIEGSFSPTYVPLGASAQEFEEFRRQAHIARKGLVGREREWWSKAETHVLRLAGTLCYLGWAIAGGEEPNSIELDAMQAAIKLVREYFWPHSRAALGQIGINQYNSDARRVLLWIKAHNKRQVSVLDVRREALGQRQDAEKTEALLNSLGPAGWLRKNSTSTRGRPRIRWEVNPLLFNGAESAGSAEKPRLSGAEECR